MKETTRIKYLTPAEKERLYKALEKDTSKYHIRNKAILMLAEYAALRASEVGMLTLNDLYLSHRQIYCRRLKRSNDNTLLIIERTVYEALTDYISYREEHGITSDCLFVSQKGTPISRKTLDDMIKTYCAAADIPAYKAHFHILKHTRAVGMADRGLDTREVQYWLGHRSIKNTEIYMEFSICQQEAMYRKLYYFKKIQEEFYATEEWI